MAHIREGATDEPAPPPSHPSNVCTVCGRRLKPVYPSLVSLGARQAWVESRLVCVNGCESWVYLPGTNAWKREGGD